MRCLDVVSINQGITTLLQQTGFIPRPYALMQRSPPPSTKPLPQHNLCALTADRQCSISLSTVVTFAQETAPLVEEAAWIIVHVWLAPTSRQVDGAPPATCGTPPPPPPPGSPAPPIKSL